MASPHQGGRTGHVHVLRLVKRFLVELAAGESDVERLKREERALREQIKTFTAADRLSRNDTHERGT